MDKITKKLLNNIYLENNKRQKSSHWLKYTKDFNFKDALKIALGMSLISMIGMEVAMNSVDFMLNGKAVINFETLVPVLLAGFIKNFSGVFFFRVVGIFPLS